jgi:uncharacterized protein YkwD
LTPELRIRPFAARSRAIQDPPVTTEEPKPSSHRGAVAAVIIILLLGGFVFFTPQGQTMLSQGFSLLGGSTSASPGFTTTSNTVCPVTSTVTTLVAPDIHGNQAAIWYPSDYCTLANYALSVINQDRAANGTAPVTLAFDRAGQQHVDSMLYYDYFSHNDTQGLKPYMRYTLLGGRAADFENVAIEYDSHFTSTRDVENAIKTLEYQMMNNDSLCCANGHRDNILGNLHTQVSIGVAYNSTTVYFGEEFVNDYVAMSFSPTAGCTLSGNCEVVMSGVPLNVNFTSGIYAVYVAYDSTPFPVSPAQLNAGPHEYLPGTLIGGVLPPCNPLFQLCKSFESGFTVYADKWTVNSPTSFDIEFPLHDFIHGQNGAAGFGEGVYTIYVVLNQGTDSAITTLSVFVT